MNRYVIGNLASGEIVRSVRCESDQLLCQLWDGETLDLSDEASDETHYFNDGQLTAYTGAQAAAKAVRPSSAAKWSNSAMSYEDPTTLADAQLEAANAIDVAAGAARLRYITEAPGQQAVYLRKAEESRAYRAAGYAGTVPPYVAAESAAMGITAQAAADRILAIADAWDGQLSPTIERLRIAGKNAVASAQTLADVAAARAAAVQQLAAV